MTTQLDDDIAMRRELRELSDSIATSFTEPVLDIPSTVIAFDPALWKALHESGLTLMTASTAAGGSGATVTESAIVIASAAAHAAPAPIVEADLLGGWLLESAGIDVPAGPIAVTTAAVDLDHHRLTTVLPHVGGADVAAGLVVLAGDRVVYLAEGQFTVTAGLDLAGQPNSTVHVDVACADVETGPAPNDAEIEFRRRGALGRSIQIGGACTTALSIAIEHAGTRQQFGRSLGKFQSVQTLLSDAAGALSMAQAATDIAVRTVAGGFASPEAEFAVAAAKIQAVDAATIVSRNSHQVLGAIGFTLDHRLRHYTSRALAWRNDFGGRREWARRLGRMTLDDTAPGAWEFVTRQVTYGPHS